MPKHSAAVAKTTVSLLKKTLKIRKSKPNWMAAFSTGRIEGGKPVAISAVKLNKAVADLRKYGITKTFAEGMKEQTSGYAWFEDGTLFLSMSKGSFSQAFATMQGYFKSMKVGVPPIRLGRDVEPAQATALEAEDDDAIMSMAYDDDADEDADIGASDAGTDTGQDTPATDSADSSDSDGMMTPDESSDDEAPAEKPLPPQQVKQAQGKVRKVATVLQASLSRILGDQLPDREAITEELRQRFEARLAATEEKLRPALLETAPGRLLMEASRDAVLGLTKGKDMSDILDLYPPDWQIRRDEVVNHFVDIGNQTMRMAKSAANVSRKAIETRVSGFFDEDSSGDEKLAAIERLTKALLPALADPQRSEQLFGAVPLDGIDSVSPTAVKNASIYDALSLGTTQVNACRMVYQAGFLLVPDDEMGDADHKFFDDLIADLDKKTNAFLDLSQQLAKRMEGGAAVPETDMLGVKMQANQLREYVANRGRGIDANDVKPTTLAAIYTNSVKRYLDGVKAG